MNPITWFSRYSRQKELSRESIFGKIGLLLFVLFTGLATQGQTPSITSLSAMSGPVGTPVTIFGTGFGASQGTVTFNGTAATVNSWNSTSIVTSVPAGATTGNVVVTAGGIASNGLSFTITIVSPNRPSGSTVDPSNALSTNLAGLFLMNEGTGTSDNDVVDNQTAAFSGSTAPTWNRSDPSVVFGGGGSLSSYLNAGTDLSFDKLTIGTMTVVAKVYVNSVSAGGIAEKNDGNSADSGFVFGWDSTGALRLTVEKSTTNMRVATAANAVTAGQWMQVAFTWDGTVGNASSAHLFINGVEQTKASSGDGSGNIGYAKATNQPFRIANASFDFAGSLSGKIAYVAVYKWRILSTTELSALDAQLPITRDVVSSITENGRAVTATTSVSGQNAQMNFYGWSSQQTTLQFTNNTMGAVTVTLLKPDGTTLISASSSSANFNLPSVTLPATGPYDIVVHSTTGGTGSITAQLKVQGDPRSAGSLLDSSNELSTNLVGLFIMNEDTGTTDTNLVDNQTVAFSGPSLPTWQIPEPSVLFNGGGNTNSYLNAGTDLTFDQLPVSQMTLAAKVYVNAVAQAGIAEKNDDNTGDSGFVFGWDSTGALHLTVEKSTTNMRVATAANAISNGQWMQVAFTWDGTVGNASAAHLFINGVEQTKASSMDGSGTLGYATATNQPFNIGNASYDFRGSLNGDMAYLAVYRGRILSTAELNQLDAQLPITVPEPPSISGLTPNSGAVGSSIVIAGTNFGSTQGTGGVTFSGKTATISSWNNTSITATVPATASTGNVIVTAAGSVSSTGVPFTVVAAPSITSLTPGSGPVGSMVVIAGTNFGSTQGNGGVSFNGTATAVTTWNSTSIAAMVPPGATTGNLVVTVAGGVSTPGISFTVVSSPSINNLSLSSGAVGSAIVIIGSNFGSSQGNGSVTFNATPGTASAWSNTSISVVVPTGATSGNVVVTAAGGVPSTGVPFTVVPAPSITSLKPGSGATGSAIVIAGSSFGSSQGNGSVTLSGTTATVSSWSNTSITVGVPAGATTGSVVVTAAGGVGSNGESFTVVPAPSISSLSPSSGPVGASVTITGTNFGASQGNGSISFNGTVASVSSWGNTSISVVVPTGATTGNIVVTSAGGIGSAGASFTVTSLPSISSVSPTSGSAGASVTINGSNFGSTQGNSTVTFNGVTAPTTSWSAMQIVAQVPSTAISGNVVVTAGAPSNGVGFTINPSLGSISPGSGSVGTVVTITGSNYGSTQGSSTVSFGLVTATPTSWNNTQIVVPVPNGVTANTQLLTVTVGAGATSQNFKILPAITSLSPNTSEPGSSVTITGTTFGASSNGTTTFVTFNNQSLAATPTSWSDTQIVVTVPSSATTGNVNVTSNGAVSNGVNFTLGSGPTPSINSLLPGSGAVGSSIVISGNNFGTTQGTVTFNRTAATVTSWSSTSVTATVPGGATTGNVVVTAANMASNGVNFTVTPPPNITSLSPSSGVAGSSVTINGTNFNTPPAVGTISFNGTAATVITWTDTSITTAVPATATTGNLVVTASGGVASNGVNFSITPSITSLAPNQGAIGSKIVITGTSFGASQGTSTVRFNGTPATATSWSNNQIVVLEPAGATTGNVVITVSSVPSAGVPFTVVPPPAISSLSPGTGLIGAPVTITGSNFGPTQGNGSVTFNGIAATVTSWGNSSIIVPAPGGASSGNVVVTAAGGIGSNGVLFTAQAAYSFTVSYAPNDDVLTANDSVNGNWTYTYDDFNRLSTAVATKATGCVESYDQYGNRWSQQPQGTGNSCFSSSVSFTGNNTVNNNRIDTFSYDAVGNLLKDGMHTYTYDAENRIISVDGGQTATYVYDGEGRRIRKVTAAGTADFIYDQDDHLVAEVSGTGTWNRGEVYADSRHIATYNNGTTYFNQSDWLGTERVRNTLNDDQCETITSLPFGDGQTTNGNCGDPSPNHFTGVPRDTETTLDAMGLRYYGSVLGRFTVSDPGQIDAFTHIDDPQSWNGYAYARNNPLLFVDPTGQGHCDRAYGDRDNMISPADCEKLGGTYIFDPGEPQIIKNASGDTATIGTPVTTIIVEGRNTHDVYDPTIFDGARQLALMEKMKADAQDVPLNPFGLAVGVRVGQMTGGFTKQINCAAAFIYPYLPGVKPEDLTDILEDEGFDLGSDALENQAQKMESRAAKLKRSHKKGSGSASRVAEQESKMLRHGAKLLEGINLVLSTTDALKNYKDCQAGKEPE